MRKRELVKHVLEYINTNDINILFIPAIKQNHNKFNWLADYLTGNIYYLKPDNAYFKEWTAFINEYYYILREYNIKLKIRPRRKRR